MKYLVLALGLILATSSIAASNKNIGPSDNQKQVCFSYIKSVKKMVRFRFSDNSKEDFWRTSPPPEDISKSELKKLTKVVNEVWALKEDSNPDKYIEKQWAECLKTTPR